MIMKVFTLAAIFLMLTAGPSGVRANSGRDEALRSPMLDRR
jgi:hypothetical protein